MLGLKMGLTPNQIKLLDLLRKVAMKMGEDGRELTGIIGELSACKIRKMKWNPGTGYDAIDKKGKRVEIKTRRDSKGEDVDPNGTIGKYGKKGKYQFNYGLYLELGKDFEINSMYEVSITTLKQLENNRKGVARVGSMRKKADRLYDWPGVGKC